MRARLERARGALAVWMLSALACSPARTQAEQAQFRGYLRDPAFRRAALVDSLVSRDNEYARLRLARYATGDARDWDSLPVWNPPVEAVRSGDLGSGRAPADRGRRVVPDPDQDRVTDLAALRALGEEAFFTYPAQLAPLVSVDAAAVERYGLWVDRDRGVSGLVWTEMPGGQRRIELTCASCHADVIGGRLVVGAPNGRIDIGRMAAEAGARSGTPPAISAHLRAWGPGRVDVTTGDASVPERMADLRPIRWASHLHYDATLRQQSVIALAIRIETLIITSKDQALRPPRRVALAMAVFLWSLGDTLSPLPPSTSAGATLFSEHCSECHAGPDLGGGPVSLAMVGTDPILGQSPERGTGSYRIPSLRGAGSRATLLHDGTVASLTDLLDPHRLDATYAGGAHGRGPVPGHRFGLELDEAQRAAVVAYVGAL
jgi:mono/diheme cytochrome c family protein